MSKKKILAIAVAVCLIAILSFSTLAWFNATDTVVNEFHVADSDGNGTPDFSVDVKEEVADEDGRKPGCPTDDGNVYLDILPGDRLSKSVFVQNTGDYNQWLRVHITFSDSAVWQKAIDKAAAAAGKSFDAYVCEDLLHLLFVNLCEEPVTVSYNVFGEDTMTYTFYYNFVVPPKMGAYIMNGVNIPGVLTQDDMNFGPDGFTITVKVEAVQVENLQAKKSSDAFAEVGWKIGAAYGG